METIYEENENNFSEIKEKLGEEIHHSINEIDNQILSLLSQRILNTKLLVKYKNIPKQAIMENICNRIDANYNNNNYYKHIFKQIIN
jgi:chorismate mutase